MLLLALHGLVVDTSPYRGFADLVPIDLAVDTVAPDLGMHPLDERLLVVHLKGGMPTALPIQEQVEPRAAGHLQVDHLGRPVWVFLGKEGLTDKGACRLTGANRPPSWVCNP